MTESKLMKKSHGGSASSSTASSVPGTPRRLTLVDPLTVALEGTDPLSQFAREEMDPLSRLAAEAQNDELKNAFAGRKGRSKMNSIDEFYEPWSIKKASILSKYTTSEKLSIVTSFLSGGEKVMIKAQSSVTDKVKHRLEQLDDFEEGSVREMLNLTQQEYVGRIEQLNQELIQAWEQDQRVKALKIAIQCSKLLVDTNVIQFYPSKFVLITDILDTFGRLVYERLKSKAEYYRPGSTVPTPLPDNFTPDMVPESAKETCRNWFYKIASIRELLPRLYVEIAIIKSYNFLSQSEFASTLIRLTKMVRGIGDPLVATYARCYLCRVGTAVAPEEGEYVKQNLTDFMASYKQLSCDIVQAELVRQKVSMSTYLSLYCPALDWILHCLAHNAPESLLEDIMVQCRVQCNSALLLNSVMAAFKPDYIAVRSLQFVEMVSSTSEEGFPHHLLFRTLGLCLVVADPPENQRLQVLNEVWKVVTKLKSPAHYISCAEVWIEYAVRHFGKREVNTFLGDLIRHMTPDRAFENHYPRLQNVMEKIISHVHDFRVLFSMDKFLPLLDMFQKESVKVEVCKTVMDSFNRHHTEPTNDPVIINALMYICRVMHDSVNALIVEDEKRQIGTLISGFVRKVNFGRDFEQQLSFYMEARAAFTKLDVVLVQLVHCVNQLAMETRTIVKGHHTRKTAAFVRACAAYSYITLPSLVGVFSRLELYLLSGQVALLNQCLSQADACFKAAISLLPEVPKMIEVDGKQRSSEPVLVSYISEFLSTLLVVPDSPEQGVLYINRGLLNILQNYSWESMSSSRLLIYIRVLQMLSAAVQEEYPYHIEKVDSNDALYGCDPLFVGEVSKICTTILEEILNSLKKMGDNSQHKKQASLAFELFCQVVINGDLRNGNLATLAVNLWHLAQKHSELDGRLAVRTLEYLKKKGGQPGEQHLQELASKLQVKKN